MSQNKRCFTLSTYLNAFANLTLKSSSKKNLFNSLLPISELDFICLALFNATLKELSFLFLEEFILQHACEAVCDRRSNGFLKRGYQERLCNLAGLYLTFNMVVGNRFKDVFKLYLILFLFSKS